MMKKLFILLCAAQILVGGDTLMQVPVYSQNVVSLPTVQQASYAERSYSALKRVLMAILPKRLFAQAQRVPGVPTLPSGNAIQVPASIANQSVPHGVSQVQPNGSVKTSEVLVSTEILRRATVLKTPTVGQILRNACKMPSIEQAVHDALVAALAVAFGYAVSRPYVWANQRAEAAKKKDDLKFHIKQDRWDMANFEAIGQLEKENPGIKSRWKKLLQQNLHPIDEEKVADIKNAQQETNSKKAVSSRSLSRSSSENSICLHDDGEQPASMVAAILSTQAQKLLREASKVSTTCNEEPVQTLLTEESLSLLA
jgi:hypothetical protein